MQNSPRKEIEEDPEESSKSLEERKQWYGLHEKQLDYSESVQEYLETIYRLSLQNLRGWVKNIDIANRLEVSAPSVSNMLHKLKERGLLAWKPRQGIRLTEKGKEVAKQIVKNHMMLELFFTHVLKLENNERTHQLVCNIEHYVDLPTYEALDEILGYPDLEKNINDAVINDEFPGNKNVKPVFSYAKLMKILPLILAKYGVERVPDQSLEDVVDQCVKELQKERAK